MGIKTNFINFFYSFFEKFDFPVKMPQEKEVLWIYSFEYEWNIFILPFLDALGYNLFKKYGAWLGQFFSYFDRFGEPWALLALAVNKASFDVCAFSWKCEYDLLEHLM